MQSNTMFQRKISVDAAHRGCVRLSYSTRPANTNSHPSVFSPLGTDAIANRLPLHISFSRFSKAPSQTCAAQSPLNVLVYSEGYTEAEGLQGIRIVLEADVPRAEYLVKWKDGSADTWEPANNLSEDLIRDYEAKWWEAARKADLDMLAKMVAGGKDVLANTVDENRRSALHFTAALGNVDCTKLLMEAGADPNLQDKEGYTPLHMAAGYMHTATMTALLEGGANPEIKDNSGKDVVQLIDNIRNNMPLSLQTIQVRLRLEEVSNCLVDKLYDEVSPAQILDVRKRDDGAREYLVQFDDGHDDEWVHEANLAPDVLEDYQQGLEFGKPAAVVDMVQVGTARRFKIQWSDDYPDSWEPEEHVPQELIAAFQQQQPELFEQRTSQPSDPSATGEPLEYETQYLVPV